MTASVKQVHRLPGEGNLKGFAVVEIGPWTIRGCRIIQQPGQRAYVALPQEKAADGRFFPILQTADLNLKDAIQAAVLQAWNRDQNENTLL
jgi:DNA-binding cell septation regulator SpoVG